MKQSVPRDGTPQNGNPQNGTWHSPAPVQLKQILHFILWDSTIRSLLYSKFNSVNYLSVMEVKQIPI